MTALFGRVFWMMAGPLGLMLAIYFIVSSGTGWRTVADVVYFIILAGMILGRWAEFRGGKPTTSDGEPATPAHLRRYVLMVLIFGPLVWIAANYVGNHLLVR
jgi:hypothetical protein